MENITIINTTTTQLAQAGENGLKNVQVEYVIIYHMQPRQMRHQDRLNLLNRLHGGLAETPLEEVTQLPLEDREEMNEVSAQ